MRHVGAAVSGRPRLVRVSALNVIELGAAAEGRPYKFYNSPLSFAHFIPTYSCIAMSA
jgi:hypothetical protein